MSYGRYFLIEIHEIYRYCLGVKKSTKKTVLPDLAEHADVEVRAGGKVTLFKVPLSDLEIVLQGWRKKYPHEDLGQSLNLIDLAIQQASGSAATPGDKVRHFRKKNNLTQVELAAKATTTQANIASIESNSRALGKDLAEKLGKALGVDYRVFL